MLRDINDSIPQAKELASLLKGKPAKINLIPFNPFNGSDYERSPVDRIRRFQSKLRELGIIVTTRKTRGDDIDAACGQLAGKVKNRVLNRLSEKKGRTVVT
jgi:23S rRNA (adenine2503-C2)-methyltransferase